MPRESELRQRRRATEDRMGDLLRAVLAVAHEDGMTRGLVADRLGVSAHTLEAWCKPSSATTCTGRALLEMLADPGVLGERAHLKLAESLLRPGGLGVYQVECAGGEDGGVSLSMLGVAADVGQLSGEVREAMVDGRVDVDEARRVLTECDRTMASMHSLRGVLVGLRDGGQS
ncbi:MAG: phage regulatory CII family protein [Planctomycetota bacterium]